jgi:hypothetical protein
LKKLKLDNKINHTHKFFSLSKTGLDGFSIVINTIYVLEVVLEFIKFLKSPFKLGLFPYLYYYFKLPCDSLYSIKETITKLFTFPLLDNMCTRKRQNWR